MAPLTAIARATSMVLLSATSLFAQRTAIIEKPPISPTLLQQLPLAAPANLTLTPAATSASLRWDPVSGATGYLVTRTTALYGTIQQTPTPITSTSFTDVSQQFDPRYIFTYKVMAVYPDGRYAAAEVTYLPPPATVSFPKWSGQCYGAGIIYTTTWAQVPEATGYVIRYLIRLVSYTNNNGTATGLDIVDTLVTVPASPTSHVVRTNGACPYGNIFGVLIPKSVDAATVSAVFANGAKSAETVCSGTYCSPPPWPYARMTH